MHLDKWVKYYFEVLCVLADFISRKPRKIGAQNERIAKIAKKKNDRE
jgi:hypothetical protein